jgi:hypothetical protein
VASFEKKLTAVSIERVLSVPLESREGTRHPVIKFDNYT